MYQRVADVVEVRLPSIARASSRFETDSAFGLVTHVRALGVGLHIDRYSSVSSSRGQAADAAVAGYSQQGLQRASATAHQLLDLAFGPAGANAQSALSGLAMAAAQGQNILRADATTLTQVLGALDRASSVREQIEQAVGNGHQALLAPNAVDFGGLPMEPLVLQHPDTGAAAYLVTSRNAPVVQLTAQRPGPAGWLGLADAQASKALAVPALDALIGQLNTAQALLGDIDTVRWQGFAGQSDIIDGLYQSRVSVKANTADTCDWLVSTLTSQLGAGLPSSQRVNHAPVITSQPALSATLDQAYGYSVVASDPDGDALSFTLMGAPTGMAVDSAGRVGWARAVAGEFNVTIQVSDGVAVTEQSYKLTVGSTPTNLQIDAALSPSIATAGQSVSLTVNAASSAGAVSRSATLDGAPLVLSGQGIATFTAPAAGTHVVLVTASDGQTSTTRELLLTVRDAVDVIVPVALISSPEGDDSLRGIANIRGSASDASFAYYQLRLRRVGESDSSWQEVGRGLSPVTNGQLGQLDTSRYDNGMYQIALRVVDVNGRETMAAVTVEFVGNLKLGQFRLSFADVRAEAAGLPLMLTRTYDTTKKDVLGDFGWGWSASGHDITVKKNMVFGVGWEPVQRQFQLCLIPVGRRRISITLPDGGLYRFDAKNAQECSFGQVPEPNIVFTAVPGPTGGASGRLSANGQLKIVDGALVLAQGGMLVDSDTGLPWNPKDFELTTEEGFKYVLREGAGILSVTDPFGNKVSYGANGYNHSASLSVTFIRDAQGRIIQATDPGGKSLSYTYSAQGELQSVTDRDGKTTQFTYATVPGANTSAASGNADLKHLLASITDPRGQVVMSNQFDALGRLTGTADALGQSAQQEFDLAANKQTVTDRRGNKSVYTFDADGNITQSVNALGQTTTFTFDANGNETSVTNALNERTERTFEPLNGKQLSEKTPLGHTVSTAYPVVGSSWQRLNPLSTTDAKGNVTQYGYEDLTQPGATPTSINEPLGRGTALGLDLKGNLRSLNIAGETSRYSYDSQGRRIDETNGLGQTIGYTFDANGNETRRTVAKSVAGVTVTQTTTKVYDAENRLIEETDAMGGKRITTYNAAGKVAAQTDSLGRKTSYSYDANARLIRTEYPDATSETTAYDLEGNETAKTDRAGRITRMTYDALNRLVRTDHPDGSFDATEYDPVGRVIATVDRNGRRSTMEYDAAGRQTASVDATGRRTSQTFDENGNRTGITADGRTTSFTYDALNRLTKTTWPDGSTHSTIYRPDNRKQSETDQRGVVTAYGYDAAGRPVSVAQSLSATATATTAYGYDETGGKVRQVDALGRTTTWIIDANGRITGRKIQDGATETSQYDAEGNRLTKRTFAGETLAYQYDAGNRITASVIPQGAGPNSAVPVATISYKYTASGQLESQQEQGPTSLDGTQSYRYDANDRLVQVTSPVGEINYTLDANGNPVERSVSNAAINAGTTKTEYDAAGRISKVIAPDGKEARYTYDQAGRLTRTERDLNPVDGQQQLLVTYLRHDQADRVIAIAHVKQVGGAETVVAGQALTRGSGGTITKIDTYRTGSYTATSGQFTGTPAGSDAYEYDGNARLTRETRTQESATTDTQYQYDAAGNRSRKTVTTAAGTETTSYSYDAADRLTQEQTSLAGGGSTSITYQWDGNGNLRAKSEPGKTTLYRFDANNRLIDIRAGSTAAEAASAQASITYSYDASGNRIRKSTPPGSTAYLIDNSYAYAQVALETKSGAQSESTTYVRGVGLVRQTKTSQPAAGDLFPLHGHLSTSLGALDAGGNVVEQVEADAFGILEPGAGVKQAHLYTGEYWDQDAQLLYLRARWYDPSIGRFISADPFEGKQHDPRSLNRYNYARSDPVGGSDPGGRMTLSEVGSTMDTVFTLANRAYNAYDLVSSVFGGDDEAPVNGKGGLWESLLATSVNALAGSVNVPVAAGGGGRGSPGPRNPDGHHTVPKYMCGHAQQWKVHLSQVDHTVLHRELEFLKYSINAAGLLLDRAFRKSRPPAQRDAIVRLSRTIAGRAAIAKGLEVFYKTVDWWNEGIPFGSQPFGAHTIGELFPYEAARFIANHHSYPTCTAH
jgi:RHS repeat-associated protein